jgi:hypothetical protein
VLATIARPRARAVTWWASLPALHSDAILYGLSAIFAIGLGLTSHEPAQWHWGYLAAGPYAGVAALTYALGRVQWSRETTLRTLLAGLAMVGAVAVPLGLEARWRQVDHLVGYAQPEVSVIERAGDSISHGRDPYRAYVVRGRLVGAIPGVPAYQSFFPYFPLMGLFGLPSAATHRGRGLTDARIVMSLMTLLVSLAAIAFLQSPRRRKVRVAQVLLALPTGALFLATGGDDMPILALCLLGVVALQRRWTVTAAVSLGLAAAMKLTAWPLAVAALLIARRPDGRRDAWRLGAIEGAIVLGTVAPFAWGSPRAFLDNVFAFPLGLAGIHSPAASPLPGHILMTLWSGSSHVLAPLAFVVGGTLAARYLHRRWPVDLAQVLALLSVAFVVAICVASATRIGYVIYPLNLALWAMVTRVEPEPALVSV